MSDPASATIFTIDIERSEDAIVVRCHGRLVSGSRDVLNSEVSPLIPQTKRIVLDLTDLTYMDSMGLGTVIRLYVSAKSAGCRLEAVNIGERIQQLLRITNLLSLFSVVGENDIRIP